MEKSNTDAFAAEVARMKTSLSEAISEILTSDLTPPKLRDAVIEYVIDVPTLEDRSIPQATPAAAELYGEGALISEQDQDQASPKQKAELRPKYNAIQDNPMYDRQTQTLIAEAWKNNDPRLAEMIERALKDIPVIEPQPWISPRGSNESFNLLSDGDIATAARLLGGDRAGMVQTGYVILLIEHVGALAIAGRINEMDQAIHDITVKMFQCDAEALRRGLCKLRELTHDNLRELQESEATDAD